jgi:hypothetical protein
MTPAGLGMSTSRSLPSAGLLSTLAGDGRPLITATGLALVVSGLFAIFLGVRKEFLPHDEAFLGMTPRQLCSVNECRVVHFMIHDRVSFGGALTAVGLLYLWLAAVPVAAGGRWAWWTLAVSGVQGFASFLAYLGYGYLDTWHGAATLALLPCFAAGLALAYRHPGATLPSLQVSWKRPHVGRLLLLFTTCGMLGGGLTITVVGMTCVFVPEDVAFMGVGRPELDAINARLVPLIAHDRAGFGGAVCCCGILLGGVTLFAEMSRSLWQALAVAGLFGFGTAVGVHPAIGYTDWWHLAPAVGGAAMFFLGLALTRPPGPAVKLLLP